MVAADMALPENALAVVEAAMKEFGHVDVLVNNAGKGTAVPATRETPEQFREVIDINLNGCYWMAQACGRVMQPGSAIINIASVAALASGGLPQAAYSASKAGLIGLTRDLAVQWTGRKGIRVTALAPGYFPSEMNWRISTTDSAWCTWNTTAAETARQYIADATGCQRTQDDLKLAMGNAVTAISKLEDERDRLAAELAAARERRRFGHRHVKTLIQENAQHLDEAVVRKNERAERIRDLAPQLARRIEADLHAALPHTPDSLTDLDRRLAVQRAGCGTRGRRASSVLNAHES